MNFALRKSNNISSDNSFYHLFYQTNLHRALTKKKAEILISKILQFGSKGITSSFLGGFKFFIFILPSTDALNDPQAKLDVDRLAKHFLIINRLKQFHI